MSYMTNFTLKARDVNEKDYAAIEKEVQRIRVFDSGDIEYGYMGTAYWDDADEDMKLLYARFPDVVFKLRGASGDYYIVWVHYYKGGRVMYDGLVVTVVENPFDERMLEGEATVDNRQKYSYEISNMISDDPFVKEEQSMTRNEMVQEATKRMRFLNIDPRFIEMFEWEGKILISEQGNSVGWANDICKGLIRKLEDEYGVLVYYGIHCDSAFGELLNLLYVSQYSEEWEQDREDLSLSCPMSYVFNLNDDRYSEFGSILIEMRYEGYARVE